MTEYKNNFLQSIFGKYDLSSNKFIWSTNNTNNVLETDKYVFLCIGNVFDKDTFVSLSLEQILCLYEELTSSFLDRLDGLFTLVFFHKQKHELYIFQDYMSSILPLYYTVKDNRFYFSTSLKYILHNINISRTINTNVISCLLKNFCIMNNETLLCGVYKLEPKQYLQIHDSHIYVHTLSQKPEKIDNPNAQLLKQIIEKYIKNQCQDVEKSSLNMALSGGYDSNLLLHGATDTVNHVNAYSIGASYGTTELSRVSNIVENNKEISWFSHVITDSDYEYIPDMVFRLEGAVHENGVPLQYFLAKLAQTNKVHNLLCGESADETMFINYHDDSLKYSMRDLSLNRISFKDNPFYSTNLVVLKKSSIFLNSFGITPLYPYKTKLFISFANAIKEQNANNKILYKHMCEQILPQKVLCYLSSCGGATDPRAILSKNQVEKAVYDLKSNDCLTFFNWATMSKQDILSAYDTNDGFEIISDILSGIFLLTFKKIFLSGIYDEYFTQNTLSVSMSDLLKIR